MATCRIRPRACLQVNYRDEDIDDDDAESEPEYRAAATEAQGTTDSELDAVFTDDEKENAPVRARSAPTFLTRPGASAPQRCCQVTTGKRKNRNEEVKERKESKHRIAAREKKAADKQKAAAEERPVVALPAAKNRPADIDAKFDAAVLRVVLKHGDLLRFNPRARTLRRTKGVSPFNLVNKDRTYWTVVLYNIFLGRFKTQLHAAWFAQLLMENRGHPQACRNFDADGEFCFKYDAFLAQFKPFTSATPHVYVKSEDGLLHGAKKINGKYVHSAAGTDEVAVAADLKQRLDRAKCRRA
jgi:hypothetical protein